MNCWWVAHWTVA